MRPGCPISSLICVALTAIGALCPCLALASEPSVVVGRYRSVIAAEGDTLLKIARRYDVNAGTLLTLNADLSGSLHPGDRVVLPTLHILPPHSGDGIYLNIPERHVYLFRGGQLEAVFPVAVGQPAWPTRTGRFTLATRVVNPQWRPTRDMVARTPIRDEIVPAGLDNPVGDRWMGWSAPGYGFHSTTAPITIGHAATHGCVRLYPEAARRMFDLVRKGDRICSLYEPVLLGRSRDSYYLAVCPDIYHEEPGNRERVAALLREAGLADRVDRREIAAIVRRQTGYPTLLHLLDRASDPTELSERSR